MGRGAPGDGDGAGEGGGMNYGKVPEWCVDMRTWDDPSAYRYSCRYCNRVGFTPEGITHTDECPMHPNHVAQAMIEARRNGPTPWHK